MTMLRSTYRRLSRRGLRLLSAAISGTLGLVFGCDPGHLFPVAEYGMPTAQYKVSGTVRDAATRQPIAAVQVVLRDSTYQTTLDSTTTDSLGRYLLDFREYPLSHPVGLHAHDADGADNGTYVDVDTVISIPESELTGGDGSWDDGHAECTVDISMQPGTM